MRGTAAPPNVTRLAGPWLAVISTALVAGLLAAGRADTVLGAKAALLVLGALVGCAFLVIFSFLGSAALLIWPIAATAGYLLAIPRGHPVITFDRLWLGGLVAYILLTPRVAPRTPATRFLIVALLWLLIAFGVRSFATNAGFGEPVRTWLDAIVLPAILFVACERYCLGGLKRGRNLACALMIAGGVLGAIGLAERIFGFELATLTGGSVRFDAAVDTTRVSGPYPAPEPYALSLIICLGATFFWILSRPRGKGYGWGLVLMSLQLTGIALALFRAGWIAAVLVAIASLGYRPGRFGRTFVVTILAVAVGFAATTQLQSSKTVATRVNNTDNIWGRLATYEQGVQIFRRHPVFGIGVDRYHDVAMTLPPVVLRGVASVTYPHSSYIGTLAEQGLLGFVPLLVLTFAVWRLIGALRAASFASREALLLLGPVVGVVLGYLIMSLTLTMLPYEPSNAFFAALLGIAAGRVDGLTAESRRRVATE
jgi:hypothetical protein